MVRSPDPTEAAVQATHFSKGGTNLYADSHATTPKVEHPSTASMSVSAYRSILFKLHIAFEFFPLLAVYAALLAMPFVQLTWTSVIVMIGLINLRGYAITVGYHRYFSHRAFRTYRWLQFLFGLVGCTAIQRGPLWWALHHRRHHAHSDTPKDVHSPVTNGFWHAHVGWLFDVSSLDPDYRVMRDFTRFPELVWLDRLWMFPGFLLAGACFLLDGWAGLIYGFCLSSVLMMQFAFAVNSFGHLTGPRAYATADGSRNNWVLGFLALGDGWHNNHHRFPRLASHGLRWYEYDPSYLVILALEKLRLVWDVKKPTPSQQIQRSVNEPPETAIR
jgi:stearoyl-CoA desaturase (Delta-9 desaturase)